MVLKVFITLIAGIMCATGAWAVEVSPGTTYQGGTKIESAQLGVSIVIPTGWQGGLPQGSEAFILRKIGAQGVVLVRSEEVNSQSLLAMMNQQIRLDVNILLLPIKKTIERNGLFAARYTVSGQPNMHAAIQSRIGKYGVGVALIGISPAQGEPQATLATLMKSLRFQKPVVPELRAQQGETGSWQNYMKGRYMHYFFTTDGFTDEDNIWLCSNGSFFRSRESGGFGGGSPGVSGASSSGVNGRWNATGMLPGEGMLHLQTRDGTSSSFSLSLHHNKIRLNNSSRWFKDNNNRCQ